MIKTWPRVWRTFALVFSLALVVVVALLAGCSGSSAATSEPAPAQAVAAATRRPTLTATPTRHPTATVTPTRRAGATATRRAATATPTRGGEQTIDGLPIIRLRELPPEALDTLRLIDRGGPFPYAKDGAVFQNREGVLPRRSNGYYHEFTVITPGENDRGARRIVTGADDEFYYTDDHYDSFKRIVN